VRVYGTGVDYVGVIFGKDLVYKGGWSGNRKVSHYNVAKRAPEEEFVNLIKQSYRVLLTRGMKGCYAFFEDVGATEFFLCRVKAEGASAVEAN